MRRIWLLLCCLVFACGTVCAEKTGEPDGWYETRINADIAAWEEAVLPFASSYYSGETVYKGSTRDELYGACALHSASVVITNQTGEVHTAQEMAAANNAGARYASSWTNYVAWGKTGSRFGFDFSTANLALVRQHMARVSDAQRRADMLQEVARLFDENGSHGGLILHFNSSQELNGAGTRHVVVMLGYVLEEDTVCDLLINDSSVPAPQGVCVRLSQSSLPKAMLGEKRCAELSEDGENMALRMMDYIVSGRWLVQAGQQN